MDHEWASRSEVKHWSLGHFRTHLRDGSSIVWRELLDEIRQLRIRFAKPKISENTDSCEEQVGVSSRHQDRHCNKCTRKAIIQGRYNFSESSSSLAYGIDVLSKLLAVYFHYVPSFLFGLGLYSPSRLFIGVSYFVLVTGFMAGSFLCTLVVGPTVSFVMPNLVNSITSLLAASVTICQIVFVGYALVATAILVYWRKTLHDFLVFHCPMLTVPKRYQRKQLVQLFSTILLSNLFAEPFFLVSSLIDNPKQTQLWFGTDSTASALARIVSISLLSFGSLLIGNCGSTIPLIASFLIVSSARHLQSSFEKQLARLKSPVWHGNDDNDPTGRNEKSSGFLLDEATRRVILDYSCTTLTSDWPELLANRKRKDASDEANQSLLFWSSPNSTGHSRSLPCSNRLSSSTTTIATTKDATNAEINISSDTNCGKLIKPKLMSTANMSRRSTNDWSQRYCKISSIRLLFLYKSLIKSLSELKTFIRVYEHIFGTLHFVYVCIKTFVLALWLIVGATEVRLLAESRDRRTQPLMDRHDGAVSRDSSEFGWKSSADDTNRVTSFEIRLISALVVFCATNIFIFIKCDHLANYLNQVHHKLFKMNIDLACSALANFKLNKFCFNTNMEHKVFITIRDATSRRSTVEYLNGCQRGVNNQPVSISLCSSNDDKNGSAVGSPVAAEEYRDLDQVWLQYDQLIRLSESANFKLTSGVYYSKRCLLGIFGRLVSLTLFGVQALDVYLCTLRAQ